VANLLIFQRLIPVLSLRALATSSRGLKKDYPWSDDLEKLPDPSSKYMKTVKIEKYVEKN